MLRHDPWLSDRLGKPAYHVAGEPERLTLDDLPRARSFIGAKVPVGDVGGILHLQALRFTLIDTNVQLSRLAGPMSAGALPVRFAVPGDARAVRRLARDSFVHNRFHRDPQIDDATASALKEAWAGNYFSGDRGDWMVIADDDDDGPIGFLQLLRREDDVVTIDLIAVASDHRGRGVARAMIAYASEACLGEPAPMLVGTQISNIPSLGLYTGLDFRVSSAAYVLHLHVEDVGHEVR